MKPFDYLIILISVVIGLCITTILGGFARLIDNRRQIRFDWLSIFWALWLLAVSVQHWWAKYSLRKIQHWTFAGFLFELATPGLLYLCASIVLPQAFDGPIDLREWFLRNRRWFFGVLTVVPICSLITDVVNVGFRFDLDHGLVALAALLSVSGLLIANVRWQMTLAAISGVFLVAYIGLLFNQLATQ